MQQTHSEPGRSEENNASKKVKELAPAGDLMQTLLSNDLRQKKSITNEGGSKQSDLEDLSVDHSLVDTSVIENNSELEVRASQPTSIATLSLKVEKSLVDKSSSNVLMAFDEPRSRRDRRAKNQPYLMPDTGCRRKRTRRGRRLSMRSTPWWMLRSYTDKEFS